MRRLHVMSFLEMAARHALFNQSPACFYERLWKKEIAIAQYDEEEEGHMEPARLTVCYEGKCVPLLPGKNNIIGPNLEHSLSLVKKAARSFLETCKEEREERNQYKEEQQKEEKNEGAGTS